MRSSTIKLLCLWLVPCISARSVPAQSPLQQDVGLLDHSQGYKFDPLLHLPGTSPYFDAVGFGLEHAAPLDCKVTAASYLIRHGAIYANDDEYEEYIRPFLYRLEKHRGGFSGPLEFLNTWTSPFDEDKLEDLTETGARDAEAVGKHLRSRYPDLSKTVKRVIADKKSRCQDTAKSMIKAFPNPEDIEVVTISKHDTNGSAVTLLPHKKCKAFSKEPGTEEMHAFLDVYGGRASARLSRYTPAGFDFPPKDILAMQSVCGYESAIRGKRSRFCGVFTDAEWMSYEYAYDMKYAYMVGPLNKLSPYLGFPWLLSQTHLFDQIGRDPGENNNETTGWPTDQRFFLSFTHREVPPFVAAALGIFNSSSATGGDEFPTDHVNYARAWKMADLIPFLGHVGMEVLECERGGLSSQGQAEIEKEKFVRFSANTAPRPLPNCQSGPGASCPLSEFRDIVRAGAKKYGDFDKVCKNKKREWICNEDSKDKHGTC